MPSDITHICGIRNAGGTCWFSAVMILLYHLIGQDLLAKGLGSCVNGKLFNLLISFFGEMRAASKLGATTYIGNQGHDPQSILGLFYEAIEHTGSGPLHTAIEGWSKETFNAYESADEFLIKMTDWLQGSPALDPLLGCQSFQVVIPFHHLQPIFIPLHVCHVL